jgi:amino acid transporter
MNVVSGVPFYVWIVVFAGFFTWANLHGIRASARMNEVLFVGMVIVALIFLGAVGQFVWRLEHYGPGFFTHPFYNPSSFTASGLFAGTSVAVLTYIGFDGISTLSEEAENPRRNILLATVLVCLIAGILSAIEVYAAQLVWGSKPFPESNVEAAFATVAGRAGGVIFFQLINVTLLIATMGSAMGAQLAAGRLLYGMGRGNAWPRSFFGKLDAKRGIPRNNVIIVGAFALVGAGVLELFATQLGGGAYAIGAQCLNFGAFIAFMGVNASSFVRYWLRGEKRTLSNLLVPVFGFLICGFIWVHLSHIAMILGAAWMALGIGYGAYKTRGFRADLVRFDVPDEDDNPEG